ncbi:hypothetical protein FRY74_06270 [Vicingus serpentipes]|uniref:Putative endonuclease Z1 domain-containing protein n=1 Tax=Vicingus serpentipes TaxID=1926625 RepID=A0A5C6RVW0_9FLAO|nr:Z1 domain-containing protein [Vicingus serpentipes]TXB66174.1 hypothetical protein FRY74_06270 [Vicingus serpentipes]
MTKEDKILFDVVFAFIKAKETAGEEISNTLIGDAVKQFATMFPNADDGLIKNELVSHFTIGIGKSDTLYKYKRPWIANYKQNHPNDSDFPFWTDYKTYLQKDKKYPAKVINEIDSSTDAILDGMANPNEDIDFEKKGMVIGYVQSGKTGNYVGLINKGLDVGYRFIVVLAGLHNNLRQQTQFRIDEGVCGFQRNEGKDEIVGVGKLPYQFTPKNRRPQTLTTSASDGDFNLKAAVMNTINFDADIPLIAVVKKNASVLRNLNKWIDGKLTINNEQVSSKSVLIIDDECDQASVNTKFKIEDLDKPIEDENGITDPSNTPSMINKLIKELLNKFSRRAYVGYTATPYANVFIPIDNEHYRDVFPEDFIVRLDQPTNYLGPEKYFASENEEDDLPGMLLLDKTEEFAQHLKECYKTDITNIEIPESLKSALYIFIVSGAIRFYRGQESENMSMLIHASHLTLIQNQLGVEIRDLWQMISDSIRQNDGIVWSNLELIYNGDYQNGFDYGMMSQQDFTDFYKSNNSFVDGNFNLPRDFSELKDDVRKFASAVEVIVVNSSQPDSLNYHLYPEGRKVIAIGGNTMSRGLTLEGLHTSYFVRHARAFDTLMQMGRWFGYRSNYADLCRIITTSEIAFDFSEICQADIKMKQDIIAMIKSNSSPRDFLINIRQSSTSIKVTSKMGAATERRITWAGGEEITTRIDRNPEIVINNHKVVLELIENLETSCEVERNDNRVIYKKVPLTLLDDLKEKYSMIANSGTMDFEKIFEFYQKFNFDLVDVVIVGRKSSEGLNDVNFFFSGKELGLAQRNPHEDSDLNMFKVPKGKLTDANYLSLFVKEGTYLGDREKKQPSRVCQDLIRPIITFVALNPKHFYLKRKVKKGDPVLKENTYLEQIDILGDFETNDFNYIPFGVSVATPTNNNAGRNLKDEDVYINITVQNNINN